MLELLTILVIITVLIALLLPAMRRAKESAYLVACASNERQIGLAVLTYRTDYVQLWSARHESAGYRDHEVTPANEASAYQTTNLNGIGKTTVTMANHRSAWQRVYSEYLRVPDVHPWTDESVPLLMDPGASRGALANNLFNGDQRNVNIMSFYPYFIRLGVPNNATGSGVPAPPPAGACRGVYGFAYRARYPRHDEPARQIMTQCPKARGAYNYQSGLGITDWAVTSHFWPGSYGTAAELWQRSNLLMGDGSVQSATRANTADENPTSMAYTTDFTLWDRGNYQSWGDMWVFTAEYGDYQNGKSGGICNPNIGCGRE